MTAALGIAEIVIGAVLGISQISIPTPEIFTNETNEIVISTQFPFETRYVIGNENPKDSGKKYTDPLEVKGSGNFEFEAEKGEKYIIEVRQRDGVGAYDIMID